MPIKWNRALRLLFNLQSSDYGATTVAKISLYSTIMRSTVSFAVSRSRNRPCIGVKQTSYVSTEGIWPIYLEFSVSQFIKRSNHW